MTIDRIALLGIDVIVNAQRARTALRSISVSLDRVNDPLAKLTAALGAFGVAFSGFLLARRIGTITVAVVQDLTLAAAKLEKQIVDIETIAQTGQLKELTRDFKAMGVEIKGISFQQISDTMGSAARAGVRFDEGLQDLTKTALRFSMVAGDITPREATEGLAALLINFNKNIDEAENLASGINALSDNFLVTSGEILKTSARLSGFAQTTGMSIENLNALSAALLSTKISATVVRTSVSKLLIALASEPEKAAKLLNLTREEFEKFFVMIRTKPEEAIKIFITALDRLDPSQQTEALTSLGIASSRVRSVIEVLKGAIDNLNEAQIISAEETAKGTKNLDKYAVASETAAANLQNLENRVIKLKTELFETDTVIVHLTGGMKQLEKLIARIDGGEGVGFMESLGTNLGETPQELDRQLKGLERAKKLIEDYPKRPQLVDERFANPITGVSEAVRFARETLKFTADVNSALGQVELINDKIALIEEKRAKLQEDFNEKLEKQIALREEEKQKAIAARHEFIDRQRELNKTLAQQFAGVAVSPEEQKRIALQNQLDKITQQFNDIVRPSKELKMAFEAASNRINEAIKKIGDPLDALSKDLGEFSGTFGNVIEQSQKLLMLLQNPNVDLATKNALTTIFDESFMSAAKQQPEVLGLGAFRQRLRMGTGDNPEAKLLEAQLTVAKTMVDMMVKDAQDRKKIIAELEEVAKNTKNNGKLK